MVKCDIINHESVLFRHSKKYTLQVNYFYLIFSSYVLILSLNCSLFKSKQYTGNRVSAKSAIRVKLPPIFVPVSTRDAMSMLLCTKGRYYVIKITKKLRDFTSLSFASSLSK